MVSCAAIIGCGWKRITIDGRRREGNIARRRIGYKAASCDQSHFETAFACLRQTDGVLPTFDADAGRHKRHTGHFNTPGSASLQGSSRGWEKMGHQIVIPGTTA